MRFSIDLTEACPLLSSFARRETRELENSSASFSIVRVKTAPAISSADHPTNSPPSSESSVPLSAWTSPLSSPPLLVERVGHRGDAPSGVRSIASPDLSARPGGPQWKWKHEGARKEG